MGGDLSDLFSKTTKDVNKLFAKLDSNGTGRIEYSEFVTAVLERSFLLSTHSLMTAFNTLKGDDKEGISKEDLQRAFGLSRDNHKSKNDKIWQDMMKAVDKNSDGLIDFDEFEEAMQQMVRD